MMAGGCAQNGAEFRVSVSLYRGVSGEVEKEVEECDACGFGAGFDEACSGDQKSATAVIT